MTTASIVASPAEESATMTHDGARDFDFLIGRWTSRGRRLRRPLTGSTEWYEFDATLAVRQFWDGRGNFDELECELPTGLLRGVTLRLYNERSRQWTIYWANSANGVLDTPMIGSFHGGRGEFYDQELLEGRAIYVRFTWLDQSPTACHWEQAFSSDGGRTWETNWVMEFTRVP